MNFELWGCQNTQKLNKWLKFCSFLYQWTLSQFCTVSYHCEIGNILSFISKVTLFFKASRSIYGFIDVYIQFILDSKRFFKNMMWFQPKKLQLILSLFSIFRGKLFYSNIWKFNIINVQYCTLCFTFQVEFLTTTLFKFSMTEEALG